MSMRTPRLLIAALAGSAALLAASSALADNQTVDATVNDLFSPAKIAVKPGETVTFTNSGGEHNVIWNDGKEPPEPSATEVDATRWPPVGGVARTFPKSGKYRYYCLAHGDKNIDFGMIGYVYVNPVAQIPPALTGLTASATTAKAKLKFRSSRAGKAKATFFRKSGRRFLRSGSSSFSARQGLTSKTVTRAFTKGSWRVEVVVTDADKLASDKRSKAFRVS
jgi:plastocyanin